MFREFILAALIVAGSVVNIINAECANACNGHGKCTSYDMCICNRNWQASDCSERVCQFGLAHVDSPKGDLDMSGDVSNADKPVAENSLTYPYGTTESFPAMQTSDLQTLTNTAHFYMECSNKGTCNRASGECECYDGYDGAACQRASCPNSCSGHGVCKTAEAISKSDSGNTYKLWDRQSTMGCQCDKGYGGPDCSERHCKYGIDPLYFDDTATIKYSTYNFAVVTTGSAVKNDFTDGTGTLGSGTWAIRFFDVAGEDWLTAPIPIGASCEIIVAALEALPNNVIPKGFTVCTKAFGTNPLTGSNIDFGTPGTSVYELDFDGTQDVWENPEVLTARKRPIKFSAAFWDAALKSGSAIDKNIGVTPAANAGLSSSYDTATAVATFSGYVYRIKFYGNPGKLPEPQIEIYLDGKRPSLQVKDQVPISRVWTDGQQGENEDYFADHCDGVTVRIGKGKADSSKDDTTYSYLVLPTNEAINKLKACLGGSDDDETNNADVYNWDFGNHYFPHLIKLVRSTTTFNDGGYYAAVIYVPSGTTVSNDNAKFVLVNPFESLDTDGSSTGTGTDVYDVYTTKGTLALTTNTARSQTYPTTAGTLSMTNEAIFGMASHEIIMTEKTANSADAVGQSSGSVSCEHVDQKINLYCLNKTDIFTMLHLNPGSDFGSDFISYGSVKTGKYAKTYFKLNPPKLNLYTANNIYSKPYAYSLENEGFVGTAPAAYGANVIKTDISTNWASALLGKSADDNHPQFQIYKFTPAPASTYEYVAECSNRGICDYTSGTCSCFSGYSSDACQVQNSLAV